jgi:hypothetical protein
MPMSSINGSANGGHHIKPLILPLGWEVLCRENRKSQGEILPYFTYVTSIVVARKHAQLIRFNRE